LNSGGVLSTGTEITPPSPAAPAALPSGDPAVALPAAPLELVLPPTQNVTPKAAPRTCVLRDHPNIWDLISLASSAERRWHFRRRKRASWLEQCDRA
jgi:hypothetical protein